LRGQRVEVSRNDDFSEYVVARWPRLVRSAMLLGCSQPEAEDIVQTVLMRCLVHWRKVEQANDRDAYVHRALVNAFISSRRRHWTTEKAVAAVPEQAGPDETAGVDQADAVLRSLDRLTDDQRTAVVLRYYAHLTEEQMATVLSVAAGTVKSRLSRALKALSEDPHLSELRVTR
jgi:RNA polymerase sigma-70 factor (sigma-E family)